MARFILIIFISTISFKAFCQENRYSAPPPVAQYNPMTFEELQYAPTRKKKADEENFNILEKMILDFAKYVELRGTDDIFLKKIIPIIEKAESLMKKDMSDKRNDLILIDKGLKEAISQYELRISKPENDPFFPDNSGLFLVRKGVFIFSEPNSLTEGTGAWNSEYGSSVLGTVNRGEVKILEKVNQYFYKVDFKGNTGYLSTDHVKLN